MYENVVITLILIVDLTALLLQMHKKRRATERARTTRRFNRVLQSIGLR